MMCSLDVLQQYQRFGQAFLDQIVTGDETWVFHKTAETKLQSSQWKHKSSPRPVKFKQTFSQQKIMATVFWDNKGVILVEFMDRGATINGDRYRQTLTNLRKAIEDRRPGKLSKGIQLLHDNARPHTAKATTELIAKFGWSIVPHPAYSPDMAPSDYALFPRLKRELAGEKHENDESLKNRVLNFFKGLDGSFYQESIANLITRCDKCLNLKGYYIEKN